MPKQAQHFEFVWVQIMGQPHNIKFYINLLSTKTTLPKKSQSHQETINKTVKTIQEVGKKKIKENRKYQATKRLTKFGMRICDFVQFST